MATYYVIQEANIEYNDEYNYTEGWSKTKKVAYRSLEKAKEAASELEEAILSGFSLTDFDNHYGDYHPLMLEYFEAIGLEKDSWGHYSDIYNYTWGDFVEWCKENGKNWHNAGPGLVLVTEIEVENACKLQAEVV